MSLQLLQLLAQAELFDQRLIAGAVGILQIREKRTTVVNHLEQAAAAVVIFGMGFEVGGCERVDVRGQERYLHF